MCEIGVRVRGLGLRLDARSWWQGAISGYETESWLRTEDGRCHLACEGVEEDFSVEELFG